MNIRVITTNSNRNPPIPVGFRCTFETAAGLDLLSATDRLTLRELGGYAMLPSQFSGKLHGLRPGIGDP